MPNEKGTGRTRLPAAASVRGEVDHWGANALPLAGVPVVIAALMLWLATANRAGQP